MNDFKRILENNRQWATEVVKQDPGYFARRADKQEPHSVVIGCSDSRVPAETLMGVEPGEIFVHRNIANQVFPSDLNLLSVLHYAIEVLDVENVIVCGHYGCGGVKAATGSASYGVVDHWLGNIRNVIRWNDNELEAIADDDARLERLVELNVIEQVLQLSRTPTVRGAWARGRRPILHGLVYSIHDGVLHTVVTGVDGVAHAESLLPASAPEQGARFVQSSAAELASSAASPSDAASADRGRPAAAAGR